MSKEHNVTWLMAAVMATGTVAFGQDLEFANFRHKLDGYTSGGTKRPWSAIENAFRLDRLAN